MSSSWLELGQNHMIMNHRLAVAKIQDADAFVYENENMGTWVPKLLDSLDAKK